MCTLQVLNEVLFPPTGTNATGIQANREGVGLVNSTECTANITTRVFLVCSAESVWDPQRNNVSKHIILALRFLRAPCSVSSHIHTQALDGGGGKGVHVLASLDI